MLKNFKTILLLIVFPVFIKPFESSEVYSEPASKKQKLAEEQNFDISQESMAYFFPDTDLEDECLNLIKKMPKNQEVFLSNYGFGSKFISGELSENACRYNITTYILLDKQHAKLDKDNLKLLLRSKKLAKLSGSDKPLYVKKAPASIFNNCKDSLMHQKILILGNKEYIDKTLVMGSYNFSDERKKKEVLKNPGTFENIIVLRGPVYDDMINKQIDVLKSYYDSGIDTQIDLANRQVGLIRDRMPVMLTSDQYDIKETLLELIRQEQASIKIAMFTFTSDEIFRELINAHNRGIDISVYVDNRQAEEFYMKKIITKLIDAGINTKLVRSTRMHHKFLIFKSNQIADGKSILANGSYNLTEAANSQNLEDIIFVADPKLINLFEEEFTKINNYIENVKKNSKEYLLKHIREEQKSIKIAMYSFRDNEISRELINAHNRGVEISVYINNRQAEEILIKNNLEKLTEELTVQNNLEKLKNAGININLVRSYEINQKFFVFDSQQVAFKTVNSQNLEDIIPVPTYQFHQFLKKVRYNENMFC